MSRFREELRTATRPRSAAELAAEGVSRRALEGPRWARTSYGLYLPASVSPDPLPSSRPSPTQRILEVAPMLPPGAVIGGWAAAYALGADLLDGYDKAMRPLPVTVILPPGLHRVSTRSVRYVQRHASRPPPPMKIIAGIPFTAAVQTTTDLARWAPDLVEAVVAIDAVLRARLIRLAVLEAAASQAGALRGVRQLRRAAALSRLGVRSPWESRLRMFWVLELELPPPLVNQPVFDARGKFLGAPDLLDAEAGLAMEYDGASWRNARAESGHRDPDQHREDNVREETFERTGLIVVRADKVDLTRYRDRLAQRLRDARMDGLRRDRSRDTWTLTTPADWLGMPA